MNYKFFSIVIPAHNEEKLIEQTLECLVRLDYPKNKYEVIPIFISQDGASWQIGENKKTLDSPASLKKLIEQHCHAIVDALEKNKDFYVEATKNSAFVEVFSKKMRVHILRILKKYS